METPIDSTYPDVFPLLKATPKPSGVYLAYGTAGFRAVAELLPSTFLRMGMLAALRARKTGQVRMGPPMSGNQGRYSKLILVIRMLVL